jgi:opacity protein-like surface antigen
MNHNKLVFIFLSLTLFQGLAFADESIPVADENISKELLLEDIYRELPTNSIWENNEAEPVFYQNPYQVSLFSPENGEDSERLWSQSKSIFAYGVGVIGALYMLPESVTNWDKDVDDFIKWGDNVKDGPVWDRDDAALNWIGHPYFGSVYYLAARKSGYRQWDSFVYSFLMSTFYWEYGIEALAEIPSIQDIVITPVIGWVWGEFSFQAEQDIRRDDGQVWGSEFLGATALILIDPIDSAGRGLNSLFGYEIVKAGTGYLSMKEASINSGTDTESYIQLNVSYNLGDGSKISYAAAPNYYHDSKDPIDYSIIGLAMGGGYIDLSDEWGIEGGTTTDYSLGLYFSRSFSLRVSYAKGKLDIPATATEGVTELHYENYSLNGQYYFNTEHNLRPYLTAGVGEMLRDRDNKLKTFQVHIGTGLHYQITNNLAFQMDYRRYNTTRYERSENVAAATFIYRLGKGEWY